MSEEVRNIIIYDIFEPSIYRLYQMDFENIRIGVSERNICARLALHMEILCVHAAIVIYSKVIMQMSNIIEWGMAT